jgi:hypothetical protein
MLHRNYQMQIKITERNISFSDIVDFKFEEYLAVTRNDCEVETCTFRTAKKSKGSTKYYVSLIKLATLHTYMM